MQFIISLLVVLVLVYGVYKLGVSVGEDRGFVKGRKAGINSVAPTVVALPAPTQLTSGKKVAVSKPKVSKKKSSSSK